MIRAALARATFTDCFAVALFAVAVLIGVML